MRILHKKLCLLMLLLISCHLNILAQGKIITGVILDKTGETVIGASVLVKGTTNGTITDVDGNFTLNNVQENAVLQVSFVGYKTQDIALKGQSNVKVTLEEDTEVLDEVVVIGYGSVKKSTLTGAVAKMDTKGIQDRPLARPETALQGQSSSKCSGQTFRSPIWKPPACLHRPTLLQIPASFCTLHDAVSKPRPAIV